MDNSIEYTTDQLNMLLTGCEALPQAVELMEDHLLPMSYRAMLLTALADSKMDIPEIAKIARLSRICVYQAFEGIRVPTRETMLRIALAMRLSLRQIQTLLRLSRRGELYARIRRDAILIFAFEHGLTISETNESLKQYREAHFYDEG